MTVGHEPVFRSSNFRLGTPDATSYWTQRRIEAAIPTNTVSALDETMVKHAFMLALWRFQASQAILGLVLWGILLTLSAFPIIWPRLSEFFVNAFGIQPDQPGAVFLGLGLLFALIMSALFAFGLIYDKYLRLWREQTEVAVDRNPYTKERLTAKEILTWRHMFLPALRAASSSKAGNSPNPRTDPEVQEHIEFMEHWIAQSLENPRTRRAVEETQDSIEPKP